MGSFLRMKLPLFWFWGKWGHLWGRAPWTWSWPGPPGCWGVHCIGLWLHCQGLTWSAPFLSFVICVFLFKIFVSPPCCFLKFCYLLFLLFIQEIRPLVVFFFNFCYLLFIQKICLTSRCYLFVFIQQICLTPSLLTTIVPITPLWLTSRFRVSSTSDAIFLKYQIYFFLQKESYILVTIRNRQIIWFGWS